MGRRGVGIPTLTYVLDASAMIAFLRDEPGAGVVAEALLDSDSQCYAHALNLCEVFYDFHRASRREDALDAIADLARVGVVADSNLSSEVWQAAGTLKAILRRVSLADCFAIELADRLKAVLLTSDHHEFDVLAEQAAYRIQFIR
jgi:predicted nucleic acid-binding protein